MSGSKSYLICEGEHNNPPCPLTSPPHHHVYNIRPLNGDLTLVLPLRDIIIYFLLYNYIENVQFSFSLFRPLCLISPF